MQVEQAQRQIAYAFANGGPGAIVSSLVWLMAGWFLTTADLPTAFAALFIGGIFIFPLSSLICKFGFARSASVKGNPLGLLCLESTIAMIGCLLAAWLLLPDRADWVFPVAAIAVGTHYFAFKTAYGDRTFWVLGAIVTAIGCAGVFLVPGQSSTLPLIVAVAVTELAFGILLTVQGVSRTPTAA